MPSTWKTVRVFISSTFRDMHAERDHLVKVVFPALRERLEKYRVHLDDIDLRWGVTKEQAENDKILDLCLKQIKECRPFFIGILGERYGTATQFPEDAVRSFPWIQEYAGRSVTELEILHGVLNTPSTCERAFFYFRDPKALEDVPELIRQQTYAEIDSELQTKLADLKQRIKASGRPVMDPYPARWDAQAYDRPSKSHGRLVGLEEFDQRVQQQLWDAISAELKLEEVPATVAAVDPLAEEADFHERFMESRLRVYVGREAIQEELLRFAAGSDAAPCLVTGPSGSGKSAVLARFVTTYRLQHPDVFVLPHFVGASPRSTGLRYLLRRSCESLKNQFNLPDEVPEETARLMVTFRDLLGKVPAERRVLIVIDALNQLDETERAQHLEWLPARLLPHVKIVVSCISDSGKTEPALEAFRHRPHQRIEVQPLHDTERRAIIREVPSLSAKTLDENQIALLLANPATANPLFLLVALEELRGFGSYEQLNDRIANFPREGDTVTAIFTQVIERLEEDFDRETAQAVVTLLASARRGLAERELQELLSPLAPGGRGVGGEGVAGKDDLFPILRQLRPYLLSRGGLLDFYHRNLFKAVREKHLTTDELQSAAHARLVAYFNGQDYFLESLDDQRARAKRLPPTPRPANVRKVDELPWQLLEVAKLSGKDDPKSPHWDAVAELFTDLHFLEAKAEVPMIIELLQDFRAVVSEMPAKYLAFADITAMERALRAEAHVLVEDPTVLMQQVHNRLVFDWDANTKLGDALRKAEAVTRVWVQRLNRPIVATEDAALLTLPGYGAVTSLAFSPDGKLLAVGSDRGIELHDVHTGLDLWAQKGHEDQVSSIDFSVDGQLLATGSWDQTVKLWDARTGNLIRTLDGHRGLLLSVALWPNGETLACASSEEVSLWDLPRGEKKHELKGTAFRTVAFSPDRKTAVAGTEDGAVVVWNTESNDLVGTLRAPLESRAHDSRVWSVAVSPDGTTVASSGMDGIVRLWDKPMRSVKPNLELALPKWAREKLTPPSRRPLKGHSKDILSVAFSADGKLLAGGGEEGSIILWNTQSGAVERTFRIGHVVTLVVFSPDGRSLASANEDGGVRLWDSAAPLRKQESPSIAFVPSSLPSLTERSRREWCIAFSPDGQLLGRGTANGTVGVWDTDTWQFYETVVGHDGSVWSVVFSTNAKWMASGAEDGSVSLWHVRTGELNRRWTGHSRNVWALAFSPDGKTLASGSDDSTVKLWNTRRWRFKDLTRQFVAHEHGVYCVAFSPDCKLIASGGADATVKLWDVEKGSAKRTLAGHENRVLSVCFSPNGALLASGSGGLVSMGTGEVKIWDVESGTLKWTLTENDTMVSFVTFSPDGNIVASWHNNEVLKLWDAGTGNLLAWLPRASNARALCFFSDSQRIHVANAQAGAGVPNSEVLKIQRHQD